MVLPKHLISIEKDNWYLWRWAVLRSAGFSVSLLEQLADIDCISTADEYLKQEAIISNQRKDVINLFQHKRKAAKKTIDLAQIRKLQRRFYRMGSNFHELECEDEAVVQFNTACRRLNELKADFHLAFQRSIMKSGQVVRNIAQDNRFQEALLWQNRHLYKDVINYILSTPADNTVYRKRRRRDRRAESLVVSYLQRYCMKNDTIGFFGPYSWANISDHHCTIQFNVGDTLLSERRVYFELWAVDALAKKITENDALLPWCSPRRLPLFELDGLTLRLPFAWELKISPREAAAFQNCDGVHTAKQIATKLVEDISVDFNTESDVFETLHHLKLMHLIEWGFEVPSDALYPEQIIRIQVERIQDNYLRLMGLELLDKFQCKRDFVIENRSDVEKLDKSFAELESTFTELTGQEPTRRAGQTYASRSLLYEDCYRNVQVSLGPNALEELNPPLTLLLQSARWFTYCAARIYRKVIKELYMQRVQQTGSAVVSFAYMWMRIRSVMWGGDPRFIRGLERELQKRWSTLLEIDPSSHFIHYKVSDLENHVQQVFDAPRPGWEMARYHNPDLMIAASSVDAINRGDYSWILGELHVALNTINSGAWIDQHPDRQELLNALESDIPISQVRLIASREVVSPRRATAIYKSNDFQLVVANDTCGVPPSRSLLVGMLVVEDDGGSLIVRNTDSSMRFDIIEFLGDVLSLEVAHQFNFVPPLRHVPRISFDRLVVHRETWRYNSEELEFAFLKEESERFLSSRRWVKSNEVPRFLFIKTPIEEKPFFVDMNSPISVELFAKSIRDTQNSDGKNTLIKITEMLPTPDQTWLVDSHCDKYTSEFRMVVVDKN